MYDLIILGAGPAGLSASIYASRYKLKHILLGEEIGGYLGEIHKIENYPGFESISGFELSQKMTSHAKALGSEIKQEVVSEIKTIENGFAVRTEKETYETQNILYAVGTKFRQLKVPGEKEFVGKGVSYCATCDAPFFRNKTVVVVGGGNSAGSAATLLTEYASKVYLVYRGESLRCAPSIVEQLEKNEKIEPIFKTNLLEVKGDQKVESVVLDNVYEKNSSIKTDGVFIEIGSDPNYNLLTPLGVNFDGGNFVKTNPDQSTNIEGIFAAGDVTTNSNGFRQIITAAAEGAVAALSIYQRVKGKK